MDRLPADTTRVSATEFKTHCLEPIQRVNETREEIVVTRYGRPLAKLVAYLGDAPPIRGFIAAYSVEAGDLLSPIDEAWEADAD